VKTNRSDFVIALGVIICSLVLLGALAAALAGWHPVKRGRTLAIDFPDVTGIREHSQLRYAGAQAGRVINIRLLTDEERNNTNWSAVRVTVELYESVPELPDDVRASLASDTLLSEKFISLSAGSPLRPKLPNGAILLGASAASLDTAIEAIGPLVQSIQPLIESIEKTVRNFDVVVDKTGKTIDTFHEGIGDALPRISRLADGLKTTADSATVAVNRIDKVVDTADPLIQDDLKKLSGALSELQETMDAAGKFVASTDKHLDSRMQELSIVLQNLKVATTHAKALTKALGEKPNRIIFSGKPTKLPTEAEILRSTKPVPVP
jgi:ABC-type transporter Mla subunit MlaD